MANYEATKYDYNGSNIQGLVGVSTGSVIPWGSASIPSGFLECDGSNVSRTTYADLFTVIGTTYGSGDGSSTFGLPDIADNVVVGKSNNKAVGSTGGANTVATTGNIGGNTGNTTLSSSQIPSHNHPSPGARTNAPKAGPQTGFTSPRHPQSTSNTNATNAGGNAHSHALSGATFSGNATSVLQPYLTVVYIIKT